jgi:hypothetical protein
LTRNHVHFVAGFSVASDSGQQMNLAVIPDVAVSSDFCHQVVPSVSLDTGKLSEYGTDDRYRSFLKTSTLRASLIEPEGTGTVGNIIR